MGTEKTSLSIGLFLAIISLATCCASNGWKCDSGQCIAVEHLCDGAADCNDGSDETAKNCIQQQCPSYAFRCAYGACTSGNAKCNGVTDCADNSDENPTLCGSGIRRRKARSDPPDTHCIAPTIQGPIYLVDTNLLKIIQPGEAVKNGTKLWYTCQHGYTLEGTFVTTCNNSKWTDPSHPVCTNKSIREQS